MNAPVNNVTSHIAVADMTPRQYLEHRLVCEKLNLRDAQRAGTFAIPLIKSDIWAIEQRIARMDGAAKIAKAMRAARFAVRMAEFE